MVMTRVSTKGLVFKALKPTVIHKTKYRSLIRQHDRHVYKYSPVTHNSTSSSYIYTERKANESDNFRLSEEKKTPTLKLSNILGTLNFDWDYVFFLVLF